MQFYLHASHYHLLETRGRKTVALRVKEFKPENGWYVYTFNDAKSEQHSIHLKRAEQPVDKKVQIIYNETNPEDNETVERFESSNPRYSWFFSLILYPVFLFFNFHAFLIVIITFGIRKENFDQYK